MAQPRNTAAIPIFGTGIHQQELRLLPGGYLCTEAVPLASDRVRGGFIPNRELGGNEPATFSRHTETLVKRSARCSACVDEHSVECATALLVNRKPLIDHITLNASHL